MCGINGLYSINKVREDLKKKFKQSLNLLNFRGPDQKGHFAYNNVLIGNTRLKINDTNNIQVPLLYQKRYIISFNGELINFRELKDIFFKKTEFQTRSDTEVVAAMYHKFGNNCLKYFNGMFAFAIFDILKNELFLARDKFGIKPLYYYQTSSFFSFSSEIKSLIKFCKNIKPNISSYDEFIVFGSLAGKKTFYKDVYKLNPSTYMKIKIKKGKIFKKEKHYNINERRTNFKNKEDTLSFQKLFKNVINDWTNSDAKSGIFLSGGIDSSLILKFCNKKSRPKTFSFYYKKKNPELKKIKYILEKNSLRGHIFKFSDTNLYDDIKNYSSLFSQPLHDLGNLSLLKLCKMTRQRSKFKVILTGDGADELFAGYKRHFDFQKSNQKRNIILGNNILSVRRLKLVKKSKKFNFITPERLKKFNEIKKKNNLDTILSYDQTFFLESYLNRSDLCSMKYGIELRPVFLDLRIFNFARRLKNSLKIQPLGKKVIQKYFLKKISSHYYGNKFSFDSNKYYMSAPSEVFFRRKKTEIFFKRFINLKSKISKFYDIDKIEKLFKEHRNRIADHSNFLLRVLSLEIWLKSLD